MSVPIGKRFGLWTLSFLVVANMIGAGIFTTSGFTLAALGEPKVVLLAWLVGGIIAICGALSYGLLIERMPLSGGEYLFLSRAAHPLLGFIAGWISLLAGFSGAIAFAALALEAYIPEILPPRWLASLVVILGALIHGFRIQLGAKVQNITVGLKLGMLVIFLIVSLMSFFRDQWICPHQSLITSPSKGALSSFAKALIWISLSYSGFNAAVYVASEAKSSRIVALSLVIGTALVTLLYLLLNAAFVLAPPLHVTSGNADIAAQAAAWIGGPSFAQFTRVIIVFALLTSVLSMMMAGPRVYSKMAADGVLPSVFEIKNTRAWPAVFLQMILALLLILIGSLQTLLSYLGLTLSLSAALSVSCLFFKKKSKPITGLQIIAPLIFVTATLINAIFLVIENPLNAIGTIITVLIGSVAYAALYRAKSS